MKFVSRTEISRKSRLSDRVVLVDGFPGCGKTLLSKVVSALERVELLSYSYEIEQYCQLCYLEGLSEEIAEYLIRIQLDMKLYDMMMGRNVNFRPSDLSSAVGNHNPSKYVKRLFESGDETIPERIEVENPIVNLAVHNMLAFSRPLWKALGQSCVLIEVVRHPLYMIRQQSLNMRALVSSPRYFTVHFAYKDVEIPYYTKGWEEVFVKSNAVERAIHFMDRMSTATEKARAGLKADCDANIITIPFELFVLKPAPWVETIAEAIGSTVTRSTQRVMEEQKVPRTKVAEGIDIDIYRRCGWTPGVDGASERDELRLRREDAGVDASGEAMEILDRLSEGYENTYWNPGL